MSSNDSYNERECLAGIAEGDEQAFAVLYHHYYQQLRPFILQLTGSEKDMEEIMQEIFIRVWLYRDKIMEIENFRAWMYKVASREKLTYLRKQLPLKKAQESLQEDLLIEDLSSPHTLHVSEIKKLIAEAVDNLSGQRQRIYRMSRDQGMTVAAIASALSISQQTVFNSLSTALKQIREHLGQSGYHLPAILYIVLGLYS